MAQSLSSPHINHTLLLSVYYGIWRAALTLALSFILLLTFYLFMLIWMVIGMVIQVFVILRQVIVRVFILTSYLGLLRSIKQYLIQVHNPNIGPLLKQMLKQSRLLTCSLIFTFHYIGSLLFDCDNLSTTYMSSNHVFPTWMKNIDLDIPLFVNKLSQDPI